MKTKFIIIMLIAAILGAMTGIATWSTVRPKYVEIRGPSATTIRLIDLPEEIDVTSFDSTHPSIMEAYRHKDTLYILFNNY